MTPENEMLWIRNMRRVVESTEDIQTRSVEYQVLADAHIIGELTYGPYYFTVWTIGPDARPGEQRWLCLRIQEVDRPDDQWRTNVSKSGYAFEGGIAGEIVTLATLYLRRRLRLGPVVRYDDQPRLFPTGTMGWVDKDVVSGETKIADLRPWLEMSEHLRADLHYRFIMAAKLYREAVERIEEGPDLAYLSLVSAIETLSGDYGIGVKKVADIDKQLANLLQQVSDEELRRRIAERILGNHRFIRQRFVRFIVDHVDASFWQEDKRPSESHWRIEPTNWRT